MATSSAPNSAPSSCETSQHPRTLLPFPAFVLARGISGVSGDPAALEICRTTSAETTARSLPARRTTGRAWRPCAAYFLHAQELLRPCTGSRGVVVVRSGKICRVLLWRPPWTRRADRAATRRAKPRDGTCSRSCPFAVFPRRCPPAPRGNAFPDSFLVLSPLQRSAKAVNSCCRRFAAHAKMKPSPRCRRQCPSSPLRPPRRVRSWSKLYAGRWAQTTLSAGE